MKYLNHIPLHTLDLTPNEEAYLDRQFYLEEWYRKNKGTNGRSISIWEAIGIFKDQLYGVCIDKIANHEDKADFTDLLGKMKDEKKLDVSRAKSHDIIVLAESLTGGQIRFSKISCPLHSDSSPSLHIYRNSNTWHCFSCGRGGDTIDLLMSFTGCSFPDAVRRLI